MVEDKTHFSFYGLQYLKNKGHTYKGFVFETFIRDLSLTIYTGIWQKKVRCVPWVLNKALLCLV